MFNLYFSKDSHKYRWGFGVGLESCRGYMTNDTYVYLDFWKWSVYVGRVERNNDV